MTIRIGHAIALTVALAALPAIAQQGPQSSGAQAGASHAQMQSDRPMGGMGRMQSDRPMGDMGKMPSERPMGDMGKMQDMRGPGAGGASAMGDAMMSRRMMGGMMPAMMGGGMYPVAPLFGLHAMGPVEHVEGRLAFLRAELGITESQQSAWNAFADAVRKNAKEAAGSPDMMKLMEPASAPERLKMMEALCQSMLSAVQSGNAALGQLYPHLNDEQKKSLDAFLTPPMSGMMAAR